MEDGAVSPRGEVIGGANNLFDFYATRKCLPKDSLNTYIEKRDLRSYTTSDIMTSASKFRPSDSIS